MKLKLYNEAANDNKEKAMKQMYLTAVKNTLERCQAITDDCSKNRVPFASGGLDMGVYVETSKGKRISPKQAANKCDDPDIINGYIVGQVISGRKVMVEEKIPINSQGIAQMIPIYFIEFLGTFSSYQKQLFDYLADDKKKYSSLKYGAVYDNLPKEYR